jgi:polysaccharide export outer membrane protein
VLTITVWGHADLGGRFTVAPDGAITFPLLGPVAVGGRTVTEIEAQLRKMLADGYLVNPQVAVEVAEYHSQRVFVVGEVRQPGPVPLTGSLTVLDALAKAGSLTEQAGGSVRVIRPAAGKAGAGPTLATEPGSTEVWHAVVRDLQSGVLASNLSLEHGDTIVVPRVESFFVTGQVGKAGAFPYEEGLTVLRALSLAGGATQLGSTGRIKILRTVDGAQKEIKVKLSDPVLPGDTVVVPTRLF